MMLLRRRGGSSARADLCFGRETSVVLARRAFGIDPVLDLCDLTSSSSACSSSFSVSSWASLLRPARVTFQLLARVRWGLGMPSDKGDLSEDNAVSDFQEGDRSAPMEPLSPPLAGVPLPTLLILVGFGERSGEFDLEAGRLIVRSEWGRGDRGTLSRTKPSGMSSPSSSSHSRSNSASVLRSRDDCQLPLRGLSVMLEALGLIERLGRS